MRPVIGIDIGFSTSKKSCGLGAMHCSLPFRTQKGYCDGEIRVSTFRLADLVHQLQEWRDRPEHALELDKAIVLIDGPVGEKGRCTTNRTVDRRCSSGAFRLRCQAFQVEQSHEFINAVEDVIEALAPKSDDRPFVWTGGPVAAP